jgi:hypothetical protein
MLACFHCFGELLGVLVNMWRRECSVETVSAIFLGFVCGFVMILLEHFTFEFLHDSAQ